MYKHAAWLPIVLLGSFAGCSSREPGVPQTAGAATAESEIGARIYGGNCVACHQQDARGIPGVYPSLVGSPVLLGEPKALALWVIHGQRPASLPSGRYATAMPQFGWMKAGDAAALFTYLRSHYGNAAPPVDAATVAEAKSLSDQ